MSWSDGLPGNERALNDRPPVPVVPTPPAGAEDAPGDAAQDAAQEEGAPEEEYWEPAPGDDQEPAWLADMFESDDDRQDELRPVGAAGLAAGTAAAAFPLDTSPAERESPAAVAITETVGVDDRQRKRRVAAVAGLALTLLLLMVVLLTRGGGDSPASAARRHDTTALRRRSVGTPTRPTTTRAVTTTLPATTVPTTTLPPDTAGLAALLFNAPFTTPFDPTPITSPPGPTPTDPPPPPPPPPPDSTTTTTTPPPTTTSEPPTTTTTGP